MKLSNNPISNFLREARKTDPDRTVSDIIYNRPSSKLVKKKFNSMTESAVTKKEVETIVNDLLDNNGVHTEQGEVLVHGVDYDALKEPIPDEELRNSLIKIISNSAQWKPVSLKNS